MPSQTFLNDLVARKNAAFAEAESLLTRAKDRGDATLSELEARRVNQLTGDVRSLSERIAEVSEDIARSSGVRPALASLGADGKHARGVSSAGQLAPLAFPQEELRRMHAA